MDVFKNQEKSETNRRTSGSHLWIFFHVIFPGRNLEKKKEGSKSKNTFQSMVRWWFSWLILHFRYILSVSGW